MTKLFRRFSIPRAARAQAASLTLLCAGFLPVAVRAQTVTVTTLLDFKSNQGENPEAGLVQGSDGNFYGTAIYGGAGGQGTIFKITPDGVLTVLHAFSMLGNNSTTIFSVNQDGAEPEAGLVQGMDGDFYGTAADGGVYGAGTAFKITSNGVLTVLHCFNFDDGEYPQALIQGRDGNFYGTTQLAGANGGGTVFVMTPGGVLTTLHNFSGVSDDSPDSADGGEPQAALVEGSDGSFYGLATNGGPAGAGTLFKITPQGAFTTLHGFTNIGQDGAYPVAGMVLGKDGNFYGTTARGGIYDLGTVFAATPAGDLTILHSFEGGTDGAYPAGTLIQADDGDFYGTTEVNGVTSADTTIFKVTAAGVLTTLYDFSSYGIPEAGLVQGRDGKFYGTTAYSGDNGVFGSVFSLSIELPSISVAVTDPVVTVGSGGVAKFTVTSSAAQAGPLTVNYTIHGNAINGKDYKLLSGRKVFPAGETSLPILVAPLGNLEGASKKTVSLKLASGSGYTVDTTTTQKVTIEKHK